MFWKLLALIGVIGTLAAGGLLPCTNNWIQEDQIQDQNENGPKRKAA